MFSGEYADNCYLLLYVSINIKNKFNDAFIHSCHILNIALNINFFTKWFRCRSNFSTSFSMCMCLQLIMTGLLEDRDFI